MNSTLFHGMLVCEKHQQYQGEKDIIDITKQHQEQQEAKRQQGKTCSFITNFNIGTLLNKSGVHKLRGVSPLMLFTVIFRLLFEGNNFYRGIVTNTELPFRKNAAYDFFEEPAFMLS